MGGGGLGKVSVGYSGVEESGSRIDDDRETVFMLGRRLLAERGSASEVEHFEVINEPEIMGGGNSRFSAALRDNWRAKSDACHHSRNLSAKILVGNSTLRLDKSLG